jgi:hypothetical protein
VTVGSALLSCCCDAPILWQSCVNSTPASLSDSSYSLPFEYEITYKMRYRPSNPQDEYDDAVDDWDPAFVPPGCTSDDPCTHREYTPQSYSFNVNLTHSVGVVGSCPQTEAASCRVLRSLVDYGSVLGSRLLPGTSISYAPTGSITQGSPNSGCTEIVGGIISAGTGLPTAAQIDHPGFRISWGCNVGPTVGGTAFFSSATSAPHPSFGTTLARMEIVVIEIGPCGSATACDQNGDPVSFATCGALMNRVSTESFCQYGKSTFLVYWRPLPMDPQDPAYCFQPGAFQLHSAWVPFADFVATPSGGSLLSKSCTRFFPNDPRRYYTIKGDSACSPTGPGLANVTRPWFGHYLWRVWANEPQPSVIDITVPSSIVIQ